MTRSIILAVIFLFVVSPDRAQTAEWPITRLPQTSADPFKIEPGRSFSVSKSREKSNFPVLIDQKDSARAVVLQDLESALDIIRENYFGGSKLDESTLTKSTLTAMLRTLDPHSNYYGRADYQELLSDQHSEYVGIGCSIANHRNNGIIETYITSTHPDSAAQRAGLRFGDRIVAVNGEQMSGKATSDVRDRIRGAKNTMVRMSIDRASDGRIETIEIRRNIVNQPSIPDSYLLRAGIGYVDLSNGFNFTTVEELTSALNDLHDRGMTSMILDLRDNPGGIVDQAVGVAGKFLPAGKNILSQRSRLEGDNHVWRSTEKTPETMPLVLLVNNNSASASEIVTGALQDYDRAIIVGEKTFGKGLVQSVIDLPSGAGLTLVTARYYTPSGRSIQRDYSHTGTYDYFRHRVTLGETPNKAASKTLTGRLVYGGDGIMPDEEVKTTELTDIEIRLLDPIFLFTRELINGRIRGFESWKNTRPIQFGQRIRSTEFFVSDDLLNSFKSFVSNGRGSAIPPHQLESEKRFISTRIRYNLSTAVFGSVAANQVLIEEDPQVIKAIEVLPKAQNLFALAKRVLQKPGKLE